MLNGGIIHQFNQWLPIEVGVEIFILPATTTPVQSVSQVTSFPNWTISTNPYSSKNILSLCVFHSFLCSSVIHSPYIRNQAVPHFFAVFFVSSQLFQQ